MLRSTAKRMMMVLAGGLVLPFSIDFSTLPDGAMPYPFQGATWAVSGGNGVCTPTLGVELLTDPGLEANYTAGKCDTLSKEGSPTLAQSADVHGGTKAQAFTGASGEAWAESVSWPIIIPEANKWYKGTMWGKRTAGAGGHIWGYLSGYCSMRAITSAAYEQRGAVRLAATAAGIGLSITNSDVTTEAVIIDDGSIKKIDEGTMMALLPAAIGATVVKAQYTWSPHGVAGVIARANARTNPNTFLAAYYINSSNDAYVSLLQCVGGTYTILTGGWSNTFGPGSGGDPTAAQWLEIRMSGSTVQLFHNDIQCGTDQTVTDVPVTNGVHGVFQSGGSQLESFLSGSFPGFTIGAFGSSLTSPQYAYAYVTREKLYMANAAYFGAWMNQAIGGNWPWSNLVRYPANLHTQPSNLYLTDYRIVREHDHAALEALTRRIYTDNPHAVIVSPIFPFDGDLNGVVDDQGELDADNATLAANYGVHLVDYRQAVIDLVAGGANLTTYISDGVHPTVAGHALCATLVKAAILANGWLNPEDHHTLPARLYDNGDYENDSTIKAGTDYDSRSGAWTDDGTKTSSSAAGATITFSATCQSYGIKNSADTYANAEVSIDGGAYATVYVDLNGVAIAAGRAIHTVTIRVLTAVTIDEFWAI